MNRDLFLAILAMDSYNRGYLPGIVLSGSSIGTAFIGDNASTKFGDEAQDNEFFASSYVWNGERIISYRGTDTSGVGGDAMFNEIWTGYGVAAGTPSGRQAELAIRFYKSFLNQGISNITVTGHSLGGGLAGLVGKERLAAARAARHSLRFLHRAEHILGHEAAQFVQLDMFVLGFEQVQAKLDG